MNFDQHRILVWLPVWIFCLCLFTTSKTFAMEIASPSSLSSKQDLEKTSTVLDVSGGGSGGAAGGKVSGSTVVSSAVPVVGNSSVVGSIPDFETKGVKSVDVGLEYPVLVLDDYILEYSSPSNLKSVKSVGSNSTIYGSLTSSTAINLFDHYVLGLSPLEHYVAWRETQYVYTLVYGDIEYSSGRFSGHGEYVRFDTSNYNDYSVSYGTIDSFGLNPQSYIVYSDFKGFPSLGGGLNEKIKDLLLLVPFIYTVLWHIFSSVPRGLRK